MNRNFFIHSSVDGHLGCFHVLGIVSSAAVDIEVHVSFHVPFGHLYVFFGEKSILILCPFFDWVFFFLDTELHKLFVYFGD